jgi:hypothetical protein
MGLHTTHRTHTHVRRPSRAQRPTFFPPSRSLRAANLNIGQQLTANKETTDTIGKSKAKGSDSGPNRLSHRFHQRLAPINVITLRKDPRQRCKHFQHCTSDFSPVSFLSGPLAVRMERESVVLSGEKGTQHVMRYRYPRLVYTPTNRRPSICE